MVYARLDIEGLGSIAQPWPLAGDARMSISLQLDRYLSVRRSLGYDLRTEERRLRRFVRFADQEGAQHVDTALFLRSDAIYSWESFVMAFGP